MENERKDRVCQSLAERESCQEDLKGETEQEARQQEILQREILEREWEMFTNVQNEGERASCQDNYATFEIMRLSQLVVWNHAAMESYLEDLKEAKREGRNLMAEKYGYMMRETVPDQYEAIRGLLPKLSEEKERLVEALTAMQVRWMEAFHRSYPHFGEQGRPVHQADALEGDTSIETYARGEMSTYSIRTLRCLKEHLEALEQQEENPGMRIMEYTARQYGYQSVQEAEDQLARLAEKK